MKLTLFYDSCCPLCVAEMERLQALDHDNNLSFEPIDAPDFSVRFPQIDVEAADRILHAQYSDGRMLYGLDVTHQAWSLVGRHRWLKILRWPIVRWFADLAYLIFARHRYTFSYLLTGNRRCASCSIPGTRAEK